MSVLIVATARESSLPWNTWLEENTVNQKIQPMAAWGLFYSCPICPLCHANDEWKDMTNGNWTMLTWTGRNRIRRCGWKCWLSLWNCLSSEPLIYTISDHRCSDLKLKTPQHQPIHTLHIHTDNASPPQPRQSVQPRRVMRLLIGWLKKRNHMTFNLPLQLASSLGIRIRQRLAGEWRTPSSNKPNKTLNQGGTSIQSKTHNYRPIISWLLKSQYYTPLPHHQRTGEGATGGRQAKQNISNEMIIESMTE